MTLTILNDVHIGANRTSGTTPQSAWQLRQDLLKQFEDLLYAADGDLMLLGDLFDGPDIPKPDLLRAFLLLSDWCVRSPGKLYLVPGNHDLSKSSLQMSAFQLLGALLEAAHGPRVVYMTEAGMTPYGYVIPHVPNQDLFDMELARVPACPLLFVHCNYDNHFAQESDHSLNLSQEQAEKLPVTHIVFAHEHISRVELDDKVVIIGNQFPSSVSDCLNNETKHRLVVDLPPIGFADDGEPQLNFVETWAAEGDYSEQHWTELKDIGRLIRVVGAVPSAQADQFVRTMAAFRKSAAALVITNAAKIEGVSDATQIEMSMEAVTNFNVREALRELLDEVENNKIDKLLEENPC